MKFKIKKKTRMLGHLAGSLLFIMLAVYGWELPVEKVVLYLVLCLIFLVVIVGVAALLGWLLARLRIRRVQDPVTVITQSKPSSSKSSDSNSIDEVEESN